MSRPLRPTWSSRSGELSAGVWLRMAVIVEGPAGVALDIAASV
jgi:hypothetical protein